jgi:hypothetical protein
MRGENASGFSIQSGCKPCITVLGTGFCTMEGRLEPERCVSKLGIRRWQDIGDMQVIY